jgi:large subunit ribosomal protein L25
MSILKLKITQRTETGKNENNRLRASGKIPVNIISNGKSVSGAVDAAELNKVLDSGIRPASLITIEMDGEPANSQVFVKEIQRFPATNEVRHIDFYRVTQGKKIKAKVGILTTGQAKGSKAGGQFVHLIHEIKVKSVPEDLKDLLILDVSNLEIGHSIKVSELPVPKSWEILINGDPIVTSVNKTKAILAAERSEKLAEKDKGKGKAPAKAAAKAPAPAAKKK